MTSPGDPAPTGTAADAAAGTSAGTPAGSPNGSPGGSSRLTVLAGPTAVGKGTLTAWMREHHPEIWISVSATTRLRRPGEQDGVHYHFVSEDEFDEIFGRIKSRGLTYWADPYHQRVNETNTNDGGRGVYWEDPNGHNLEIITRPYGSQ